MIVMDVMIVMVRQNLVEKKLANRKYLETTKEKTKTLRYFLLLGS